jgi:hypothetical protein
MNATQAIEGLEAKLTLEHPGFRDRQRIFLAEYLDAIVRESEYMLTIADFTLAALAYCSFECTRFMLENADDIGLMIPQAGYDFGLVRTGEYANAFARWPEAVRMRLTVAAFDFGKLDLEVAGDKFTYKGKQ